MTQAEVASDLLLTYETSAKIQVLPTKIIIFLTSAWGSSLFLMVRAFNLLSAVKTSPQNHLFYGCIWTESRSSIFFYSTPLC